MDRLKAHIADEISRCGPISFARFMDLALYTPQLGYYEQQHQIGRHGDFFTSVSVGPLFGELLACRFADWIKRHGNSAAPQLIEPGAHLGTLATDILRWFQHHEPQLFDRLEYWLVESSATRRQWQEHTLIQWAPKIKWVDDIAALQPGGGYRIIFSNEFLDAMPVHRLAWNASERKWDECVVNCKGGNFAWELAPPGPELLAQLPHVPAGLAAVLPAGYILEHAPAALAWWRKAAAALEQGKLLTIDYGLTAADLFRPERAQGTLRTFSRHHPGHDLLSTPGGSDITAHVNFAAIEAAGVAAGLTTETMAEQGRFLTAIMTELQGENALGTWSPVRVKQFHTLTHPEHLGHAFRALVQSR